MSLEYRIGDVFERMAEIPDGSIDLIVTSPPFLALRSYLPANHPDKAKEIGSEATPADFLDTLLALSAEWGRVLAPHGSLCVELGDTYSGGGSGGGENHLYDNGYSGGKTGHNTKKPPGSKVSTHTCLTCNDDGWIVQDQTMDYPCGEQIQCPDCKGTVRRTPGANGRASIVDKAAGGHHLRGAGWPLAKSLTGVPTLYTWSLAYGRNLLTGIPTNDPPWRIRNVIVWARPNPPVGALGDKFRPATSYITVACRGAKRYFDLDAVRTMPTQDPATYSGNGYSKGMPMGIVGNEAMPGNPAGAPPLDWHTDHHPEDGDWLWKMSTQPYAGSHYATFPMALPKRLIEAMCPLRVCRECGRPSERITSADAETRLGNRVKVGFAARDGRETGERSIPHFDSPQITTLGWSDCGCPNRWNCRTYYPECGEPDCPCPPDNYDDRQETRWRTGVVLDPFAGSGTTLEAAQAVGRHAIGIDFDPRNADLAQQRVGMFLEIVA
jgi:hypothetical protein